MSLFRQETRKARKPHRCEGCGHRVTVGDAYLCITTQYDDGTPCSLAYHPDCREWEVELSGRVDLRDDEWMTLREHVSERGRGVLDGAPPAVIARFPIFNQ